MRERETTGVGERERETERGGGERKRRGEEQNHLGLHMT
jgi:hypothetical protein